MMTWWVRFWTMVFIASAFGGCAKPQAPVIRLVQVSCVPASIPGATVYADAGDAVASAPDPGSRYQLIATANEQKSARLAVVEPVLDGCR